MTIKTLLGAISIITALFVPTLASAQTAPACPKEKLIVGTGTASGTYAKMFDSITPICEMICESRATEGGYDNLTKIVEGKFDAGIVQVDSLEFLNRSIPEVKKNIRSLFSLHGSSLHIFTPVSGVKVVTQRTVKEKSWGGLKEEEKVVTDENFVTIRSLSDLRGKPVAAWSSAYITAVVMNERLGLNMDIINVGKRAEGLAMLRNGTVFAFMGMGGKPLDWVEGTDGSKPEIDRSLMMVNVGNDEIGRLGSPYYGEKVTYRSIGALGVQTVTVRNDLVVRNIQKGPQLAAVEGLQTCFKENMEDIQNTRGKHPSWLDVSLDNAVGWEPYRAPSNSTPMRSNAQAPTSTPATAPAPQKKK